MRPRSATNAGARWFLCRTARSLIAVGRLGHLLEHQDVGSRIPIVRGDRRDRSREPEPDDDHVRSVLPELHAPEGPHACHSWLTRRLQLVWGPSSIGRCPFHRLRPGTRCQYRRCARFTLSGAASWAARRTTRRTRRDRRRSSHDYAVGRYLALRRVGGGYFVAPKNHIAPPLAPAVPTSPLKPPVTNALATYSSM